MAGALAPSGLTGRDATITSNISGGMTFGTNGVPSTVDNLIGTGPGAGAEVFSLPAASTQTSTGAVAPCFGADWYNRIHVNLDVASIQVGNLLSAQTRNLSVWNAYFVSETLNAIGQVGAGGMILSGQPTPPLSYGPLQELIYSLSITLDGPGIFDAFFTFDFGSAGAPVLEVSGARVVVWPHMAQRPITETLEFLTDVLEARTGAEQRVMVRAEPRNSYRALYQSSDPQEVALLLNELFGWQGRTFGVPQWQYARHLGADLAGGETVLNVDTTNADFRDGGLVIFWKDYATWEIGEIVSHSSSQITLARALTSAHSAINTWVVPMHLCVGSDPTSYSRTGNGVLQAELAWRSVESVDVSAADGSLTLYQGMPVLSDLNFAENAAESVAAEYTTIDSRSGVFETLVKRLAPVVATAKRWDTDDLAAAWATRQLLYALRGRQRSFWLPTFRADFQLASTIGPSDTAITVLPESYQRLVNLQEPLAHIAIYLNSGTVFYRAITSVVPAGANEQLGIDSTLGVTVNPSDVLRISYLVRSRLDADSIEILHQRPGSIQVTVPVVGVIQ